jgi:hypothetical protein
MFSIRFMWDATGTGIAKIEVITHEFEKPPKGFPNPHALC